VRADERWERLERIIAAGGVANAARRELRAQIAADIEALLGPNPHGGYAEGVRDSVAIAQGDA
jgi:hypothetical protein